MDDNHTHSPRDIGAAEDNDLTMLARRVEQLEGDNRDKSRELGRVTDRVAQLEAHLLQVQEDHLRLQARVLSVAQAISGMEMNI
jgi:hypothetical protein